jgi:uncharacterized membrane protein YvbJ
MAAKSKCVHCGAEVGEWTRECPQCGKPVANPDAPVVSDLRSGWKTSGQHAKKSKMPYILGIIAVIIIVIIIYILRYR